MQIININDLAGRARNPSSLPGEAMVAKIIKPGEEPGQGVATSMTAQWSSSNRAARESARPSKYPSAAVAADPPPVA